MVKAKNLAKRGPKFFKIQKIQNFNPYLITVFRTTDGQFGAIWTPGKKGDSLVILVMPLQTSGKFELKGFRVKVKYVHMFIFAARGQFEAVRRELAEPDLENWLIRCFNLLSYKICS